MKKYLLLTAFMTLGALLATETKAQEQVIPSCGVQVITKGENGVNSWVWQPGTLSALFESYVESTTGINYSQWADAKFEVDGGQAHIIIATEDTTIADTTDFGYTFSIPLKETSTGWEIEKCVPVLLIICKMGGHCSECGVTWIGDCWCKRDRLSGGHDNLEGSNGIWFYCHNDGHLIIWANLFSPWLESQPH